MQPENFSRTPHHLIVKEITIINPTMLISNKTHIGVIKGKLAGKIETLGMKIWTICSENSKLNTCDKIITKTIMTNLKNNSMICCTKETIQVIAIALIDYNNS